MDLSGQLPPPHHHLICFHHHHSCFHHHHRHSLPPPCFHRGLHHHHHHHVLHRGRPNHHFRHLHHFHCQFHGNSSFSPLSAGISPPSNAQLDPSGVVISVPPDSVHNNEVCPAPEHEDVEDGEGEEEDDEPVFVLTDEWREFFSKSEAKRKLEKKKRAVKN